MSVSTKMLTGNLEWLGIPASCYTDDGDGNAITTSQCALLISAGGASGTVVGIDLVLFLNGLNDIFPTHEEITTIEDNLSTVVEYIDGLTSYNIDCSSISLS